MTMRHFANQKALQDYVNRRDLVYLWEGGRAFAARYHKLSPKQRELVDVKTKRGVTRALLFSKAILRAELPELRVFARKKHRAISRGQVQESRTPPGHGTNQCPLADGLAGGRCWPP